MEELGYCYFKDTKLESLLLLTNHIIWQLLFLNLLGCAYPCELRESPRYRRKSLGRKWKYIAVVHWRWKLLEQQKMNLNSHQNSTSIELKSQWRICQCSKDSLAYSFKKMCISCNHISEILLCSWKIYGEHYKYYHCFFLGALNLEKDMKNGQLHDGMVKNITMEVGLVWHWELVSKDDLIEKVSFHFSLEG